MRFLFVDRILDLSPGQSVRGIKHVTQDDAYLCYDAQSRLCFMPSLLGETLGQLAAWNVMFANDFSRRPVAGIATRAQLHRPVYVGETLLLEAFIDALDDEAVRYHGKIFVGDELVFQLEEALGPLLPMDDFIDQQLVRQQFAEVYRPGEWSASENTATDLINAQAIAPRWVMRFDCIVSHEPGKQMCAQKKITRAAPYFPDHFPRKPVLPMTVLLECVFNLARDFVPNHEVSEVRKIKMNDFVYPGDVLDCALTVKMQDNDFLSIACRCEVEGKRVCVLELVMKGGV